MPGTSGAASFVLASSSPRRRELLAARGLSFAIDPVDVDETPPPGASPADAVAAIATRKARAAAARHPGRSVLAADTVAALDGRIVGKPRDAADARRILAALSGREHEILTGLCAIGPGGRERTAVETARPRFRTLSAAEIDRYVATGEPLDKAGAYAVQGGAAAFLEALSGDLDVVIGLPVERALSLLAEVAE